MGAPLFCCAGLELSPQNAHRTRQKELAPVMRPTLALFWYPSKRSYSRLAIFRYSIGKMPVLFLNSSAKRLEVV